MHMHTPTDPWLIVAKRVVLFESWWQAVARERLQALGFCRVGERMRVEMALIRSARVTRGAEG